MSSLPPDLEAYVEQQLASGEFGSRDELTIEALRLLREVQEKRRQLKSDIQAAIDEADRGLSRPFDLEAIKAELNTEFDAKGLPE